MLYRSTERDFSHLPQLFWSVSTFFWSCRKKKIQTWIYFNVFCQASSFHSLGEGKREICCLFPIPQLHNWQWVTPGWLFPSIIPCGEADTVIPSTWLLGKPPQSVNFHYTALKAHASVAKGLSCSVLKSYCVLNIYFLFQPSTEPKLSSTSMNNPTSLTLTSHGGDAGDAGGWGCQYWTALCTWAQHRPLPDGEQPDTSLQNLSLPLDSATNTPALLSSGEQMTANI